MADLPPVLFLSHGTTMMLGEDSRVRDYWRKLGQDAVKAGVKGVIIMGAHWNALGDKIKIATNPNPGVMPIANTLPSKWINYKPNPDLATSQRCIMMLQDAGFEAEADSKFDWMIDTMPVLIGMFPDGCPPVTIISENAHFDPFYHARAGAVLRPLRKEGYLIIGSGGGTHNLYITEWKFMNKYKDNFAMTVPPEASGLEFRQSLEDVICAGGGPQLRRGLARLMKHPYFRAAHGTDEHYIPFLFAAGAIGDKEDEGLRGELGAECWELRSQAESQFCVGAWPEGKHFGGWENAHLKEKAARSNFGWK